MFINQNGSLNENAKYAIEALEALKKIKRNPNINIKDLWIKIGNADKQSNDQMDVLLTLWEDEELKEFF